MHRTLVCAFGLTAVLNFASAQSPTPRPVPSIPHLPQASPTPGPDGRHYCDATPSPTSYPSLTEVPRSDGYLEYAGKLITWTPIGNPSECHIRQLLFNVPDVMDNGTAPGGKGVGPDVNVQLVHHDKGDPLEAAQDYDIVTEQNGPFILYRIDVQTTDALKGDYDLKISIVGYPK